MTTTPTPNRLPWPSLLVLGSATFTMVTAEMLPTAVLPEMSAGLGVSEARTGLLVSIWAAAVVVASFPLVRLTQRWDRRGVIAVAMGVVGVSAAATAVAPTYVVAVGGRLLGAAAVGLLWATANAHTADLVHDRLLARAISVVLGGATLGMVLGTPLASLVAHAVGWRASFWALGALAVAVAFLVRTVVAPRSDAGPQPSQGSRTDAEADAEIEVAGAGKTPGAGPMVTVTAIVGVMLVGHYGAYTYITRLVDGPAQGFPGGMSGLLLLFGIASAFGVALAGRFGARTARALVVGTAATALSVLALLVVDVHPAVGAAVVAAWGIASGALPPLAQTLILRLAGPERRTTASALIPVVFNGGIAVGAAAASALVAQAGTGALPVPAAVVVAATALLLAVAARSWSTPSRALPPQVAPVTARTAG
jgi:DHA1 family inner membrane transport protein